MFTEKQLQQIKQRGADLKTIEQQIENFKKGFPFLDITKAATIGDGLTLLNKDELEKYVATYESALKSRQVVKFVPASGAASRMFKQLFEFLNVLEQSPERDEKVLLARDKAMTHFFSSIYNFGCYDELTGYVPELKDVQVENFDRPLMIKILRSLLTDEGLKRGSMPKGLLKFHKYKEFVRTPVEEHLVEGANYCNDKDSRVQLHLTVSPEHREGFVNHVAAVVPKYEKQFNVKFDVTYSEQKPSTDTIAVDMNNEPFTEKDASLVFRPGGHGALIENLNDIQADLIFIKNIDNIVPDRLKSETYLYKKAIAGILINYQTRIFDYLKQLENEADDKLVAEIYDFVKTELCVAPTAQIENGSKENKINYLKTKLNRPICVCGMVKNEGEPGGGPFWATNQDGTVSLQIVESSQIDSKDPDKTKIVKDATHFNPVDLVCGVKDYKGNKFNLLQFVDPQTGFISIKSKDGKDLKAQELPGLWNGAMSDWNTIFVEVPIITFNPVKTVNDLLRPEHQC